MNEMYMRYALWFGAGFLAGALIMAVVAPRWFSPADADAGLEEEQQENVSENGNDSEQSTTTTSGILEGVEGIIATSTQAQVENQAAGTGVTVARVELSQDGWIVVHEIINGHVGNALGAALRTRGVHEDVRVPLLRGTEPGREYAVVLYADNGNRQFEVRADQPLVNEAGNPVIRMFTTTSAE